MSYVRNPMISAFAPPLHLLASLGYMVIQAAPPSWVYVSPYAAPPPFHEPNAAIKVSSPLKLSALQSSFLASSSSFNSELVKPIIKPMLEFLRQTDSHLMLNAYMFFAYVVKADKISLVLVTVSDTG
ncbi:hypothetical protein Fmac_014883 [Flemingia macrophylla]|uniref:glucan endo-1,3-beta-D-glucosidase n=1 Tax=Flemingia macrophylla TaxID=520843 RepID=A0ABD1MCZ5_9FABA